MPGIRKHFPAANQQGRFVTLGELFEGVVREINCIPAKPPAEIEIQRPAEIREPARVDEMTARNDCSGRGGDCG